MDLITVIFKNRKYKIKNYLNKIRLFINYMKTFAQLFQKIQINV